MAKEIKKRFVLELDLKTEIFHEHILENRFEIGRKIYNSCKGVMKKQLEKLKQDSEYQFWLKEPKSDERSAVLSTIRDSYDVSKTGAERIVEQMGKQYISPFRMKNGKPKLHLDSLCAQKISEDVWQSISDFLFGKAKKIHFKKFGDFHCLEGKNNKSGIRFIDNKLSWNGLEIPVRIHKKDTYAHEALQNEIAFCRIQRKMVRGKIKYYLQLVLKGIPPQKQQPVEGDVGLDIGISTVAAVSDNDVMIKEFCEELKLLDKENRRIQRKMDRSRRVTNPEKFTQDGTVKKGCKKKWIRSNKYMVSLFQLKESHRKMAAKRKILHNKDANTILRMGNKVFAEQMNYKGLQKGLYGKRIGFKAPSSFLTILNNKLGYQGKTIQFINTWTVKASQYDPYSKEYKKKRLSERFHTTGDGHKIQRDCFSAWLIKNVTKGLNKVDRKRCLKTFDSFLEIYKKTEALLKGSDKKFISSIGF